MYLGKRPLNTARLPSSLSLIEPCSMQVLDLDDNQISEVRSDAFRGMDSLSELWLYGNRLTTLEVTIFTGLPRPLNLTLGGNPLVCGAALCWMKQPYITWIEFENRGMTPECAGGDDWDSIRCPETGVFLVKFTKNNAFACRMGMAFCLLKIHSERHLGWFLSLKNYILNGLCY